MLLYQICGKKVSLARQCSVIPGGSRFYEISFSVISFCVYLRNQRETISFGSAHPFCTLPPMVFNFTRIKFSFLSPADSADFRRRCFSAFSGTFLMLLYQICGKKVSLARQCIVIPGGSGFYEISFLVISFCVYLRNQRETISFSSVHPICMLLSLGFNIPQITCGFSISRRFAQRIFYYNSGSHLREIYFRLLSKEKPSA